MTTELTLTLTPQIATQTSYAVYAARKAKEDELTACIKGWGNEETYWSGKIREEIAALNELQSYWDHLATGLHNAAIRKEREVREAEVKAIKARNRNKDMFIVGDRVRYSRHYGAAGSVRVFGTVTKVNKASYTVLTEGEDGSSFTRAVKKDNVMIDYRTTKQTA
jgi:hypothetical protein